MKYLSLLIVLIGISLPVIGQSVQEKKTKKSGKKTAAIIETKVELSELDKAVMDFCECQSQLFTLLKEKDKHEFGTEGYTINSDKAAKKSTECQNIAKAWSTGKTKEEMNEFKEKMATNKKCATD
jgi:hypothetical protein